MDKLQVSVACAMLMVFDKSVAGLICSKCPAGSYVTRNCSMVLDSAIGTKCFPCTKCSDISLDVLRPCSQYSDTVCWNQPVKATGDPEPTGVPPTVWILTGIFASMVLLALLALYFKLNFKVTPNFNKLFSAERSISEMTDFNPPETSLQACAA